MKTAILTLAFLALAGTAHADSIATTTSSQSIHGVDPAVDGEHTLYAEAGTDAFGTPYAVVLLDDQHPASLVPAAPGAPGIPTAPGLPSVPSAPGLPSPAVPAVPALPPAPEAPALPALPPV